MSRARVAALVVVVASLSAAPAGAADPEPAKRESKSWWEKAKETPGNVARGAVDVADRATDWALPGDSPIEKAGSVFTGESPLSPFHAANEAAETTVEVAKQTADAAAENTLPGYTHLKEGVGVLGGSVPGGWKTVSLAGIALLLWLLFSSSVPRNVASTAARQRFPVASAYATGRKPPKGAKAKATWAHSGRSGKADVVGSKGGRLEVCADTQQAALVAAKRRFQGHRVRPVGTGDCDRNPDKVHVYVSKKAA